MSALSLPNFAASGPIGLAAETVDIASQAIVTQTTAGVALTIPPPSLVESGISSQFLVVNATTSAAAITVNGVALAASSMAAFAWDGAAWATTQAAPASPAGSTTITATAAIALGGSRAVYLAIDGFRYADSSMPQSAHACIGITVSAVASGALATVQVQDVLTEPSWTWTIGLPVYCGIAGALTQAPPVSGAQVEIGVAKSATSILIRVQPGVTLN